MESKYSTIANYLRTQIENGVYPAGSSLPAEYALCEQFSVSRQTVRQALAQLVKERLIERRQGSGSRVCDLTRPVAQPPRSIAIVTTYISDYIFPSILREAEGVLSANNCTTMLYATKNQVSSERRVLTSLLALQSLHGVLVEGTKTALPNPNLDLYRELLARGIPLVFMNGNYRDLPEAISVLDDNYGGAYQLVEYLYNTGHRRIAGIIKNDDIQGHQRYAGYAAAMQKNGLPVDDSLLFWYSTETKPLLQPDSALWEELRRNTLDNCTAVVCYNDEIASILVQKLRREGVKIPQDLAVVSFDNSHYSELAAVTSLSHGSQNVGRLAAETLLRLLNGEACQSQIAPWQLIEKETS